MVAGELRVPGDKSIAHRALMLAAIAEGESHLGGLPDSEDVRATIACLRGLGVRLSPMLTSASAERARSYVVTPPSPSVSGGSSGSARASGFVTPHGALDCANSGTTMRLLLGLLSGSRIAATLDGDASLRRRPMARVIDPLRLMGARIRSEDGHAPVQVQGAALQGRYQALRIASAQVKSALLLAGLFASGPTTVVEPLQTRDHTERLLKAMGADLRSAGGTIELRPSHRPLRPLQLTVPGDFSSAAFWMAAAAMRPGWSITLRRIGLNPTRIAFAGLLQRMGADVLLDGSNDGMEPVGSLRVVGRPLKAIEVAPEEAAAAIDELPALLAVATQAEGLTTITGAGELRVKESDRIAAMAQGLRAMAAEVAESRDGIRVRGPVRLRGAAVNSQGDHRIAMALAVAALAAADETEITDADAVAVSYPEFFVHLREVAHAA
jgi:3-phosphoshikimate 1-carboxyvinyltransferase